MDRLKGIALIVSGAVLWGATGPIMEWMLLHSEMSVSFMLTVRLLLAGSFLLAMLKTRGRASLSHGDKKYGPANSFFSEYLACLASNTHLSRPLTRVMQ